MTMRIFGRFGRWLFFGVFVAALLAIALWPRPTEVDTATVTRGPMRVTLDEEGETRIRHRFVVSAPVSGRVLRIEHEPGDRVERDRTVIARLRPELPALLDARSRAEAEASVDGARAALGRARSEEGEARATRDLAQTELARVRKLVAAGAMARRELDAAEANAKSAEDRLQAAIFAVATAGAEVERASARLRQPSSDASRAVVAVRAPIDGVVLKRHRESESVVPAGDALVELGDPRNLEIVSDLLSTDAVQVTPGARVLIARWGGDQDLEARVRLVEPAGFTKISALGVEEQRVNVIMDFVDPADAWARLGDAYRVEVRIVRWEADGVLKVPIGALFRQGDQWAVYVIQDGRAHRTLIDIGQRNAQEAEVLNGLTEGAVVVLHPSDTIEDGARVEPRGES
jgi:HlyD family secretion protein